MRWEPQTDGMGTRIKCIYKSKALAATQFSFHFFSPPAERVVVSEGGGDKKSALFLQGPDNIFVSILSKKLKSSH